MTIDKVGTDGDGVAIAPDGLPLFVPFVLPHEVIRIGTARRDGKAWRGRAASVLTPSPDRIDPVCRHFGTCGGCALQQWREEPYQAWKTERLVVALRYAGYDTAAVSPLRPSPIGSRRRMDLAVRRTRDGVALGLHQPRSSQIVDLSVCPVLHPALVALLPSIRQVLGGLTTPRREASVIVNLTETGPDMLVRSDAIPATPERESLVAFAADQGLARLSWALNDESPEPICQFRVPTVRMGGVAVTPPPGAFLQATPEGEAAIIDAVRDALGDGLPRRAAIADLYAGCGTLTFALAEHARVLAYDGDGAAIAALTQAVHRSGLAGRIVPETRDLNRRPLLGAEFTGLAAVVMDPPFVGAATQIAHIAEAKPPLVVYVSCNPAALSRDARMLRAAGYGLAAATPIDQFLFSARLESVCVFRR